jgi:surfeit locus 1 family protein
MTSISKRSWMFAVIAVGLAAVFVGLGFWQVSRLQQRRAINESRQERLDLPRVTITDAGDIDDPAWRRVLVAGEFDFANEIVLRSRSDHGAPGVHMVTPLIMESGSAILVLRGWLPAADGLHAPISGARPRPDVEGRFTIEGIARDGVVRRTIPPRTVEIDGEQHLVLGALDLDDAGAGLPYPIAPYYVHATDAPARSDRLPILISPPALDDGPHLMYAIQWFSFALISLAGAVVYLRTRRRPAWHTEDS